MKFSYFHFVLIQKLIYAYARSACDDINLDNGHVILNRGGRIIKFSCNKSFILVGNSSAHCILGNWSTPAPFCAKTNCGTISEIVNGRVKISHGGALATFSCNPKFTLLGPSTLYCTATGWSGAEPVCIANSLNQFEICNFEKDDSFQCQWIKRTTSYRWTVRSSSLSTNKDLVMAFDHTLGPHTGGHYLFLENISQKQPSYMAAQYISPLLPPIPRNEHWCLIFFIYSFGHALDDVQVIVNNETRWQNHELSNTWKKVTIPLNYISSPFSIVIEGKKNDSSTNTAIDDLTITNGIRCHDNRDGELPYTVQPDIYYPVTIRKVTASPQNVPVLHKSGTTTSRVTTTVVTFGPVNPTSPRTNVRNNTTVVNRETSIKNFTKILPVPFKAVTSSVLLNKNNSTLLQYANNTRSGLTTEPDTIISSGNNNVTVINHQASIKNSTKILLAPVEAVTTLVLFNRNNSAMLPSVNNTESGITAKSIAISKNKETEVSESPLKIHNIHQNSSRRESELNTINVVNFIRTTKQNSLPSTTFRTPLSTERTEAVVNEKKNNFFPTVIQEIMTFKKNIISSSTDKHTITNSNLRDEVMWTTMESVHSTYNVRLHQIGLQSKTDASVEDKNILILKNPFIYFLIICFVIAVGAIVYALKKKGKHSSYTVQENVGDSKMEIILNDILN